MSEISAVETPLQDQIGPSQDFVAAHQAAKHVIRDAATVTARVYRSMIPSCHYLFSNGKSAIFINHFYVTKNEAEIQALDAEIAGGHPHLKHASEEEVAGQLSTPEDQYNSLKEHFYRQFLKEQGLAAEDKGDMGTYENGKVRPASSSDVAVAAAGGSGQPTVATGNVAALLAALKK